MDTKTNLLCSLLDCWYLDTHYLIELLDENQIDIDLDDIKFNYGFFNFNLIVYDVFRQIAEKFIAENVEEISKILELKSYLELDEYISWNDIYEIYTNYTDSHLWFSNQEIQELFENQKH